MSRLACWSFGASPFNMEPWNLLLFSDEIEPVSDHETGLNKTCSHCDDVLEGGRDLALQTPTIPSVNFQRGTEDFGSSSLVPLHNHPLGSGADRHNLTRLFLGFFSMSQSPGLGTAMIPLRRYSALSSPTRGWRKNLSRLPRPVGWLFFIVGFVYKLDP